MLSNAYFLAKIRFDTAENEQHFAEILPKTGNYPTGPGSGRAPWPPNPARRRPSSPPSSALGSALAPRVRSYVFSDFYSNF